MQSWNCQAYRDREEKRVREREVWYIPESRTIAYYLGWYFKPRLPGSQLLSKGHRQKKENRVQVTSWWDLKLVLLLWIYCLVCLPRAQGHIWPLRSSLFWSSSPWSCFLILLSWKWDTLLDPRAFGWDPVYALPKFSRAWLHGPCCFGLLFKAYVLSGLMTCVLSPKWLWLTTLLNTNFWFPPNRVDLLGYWALIK